MRLTVVIPTYKRQHSALEALKSIEEQTCGDFETIVVDNAAEESLRLLIEGFNRRAKRRAVYVREPNLGLHNARHAGARAATGEVVIFTDDDATFDPGWVSSYAEAFSRHPEMAAAGGPVRPVWEAPPPKWLIDYIGGRDSFNLLSIMEPYREFRLDEKDGYFYGVNMAVRREVLFKLNGFNPEAFGEAWVGDGETGLNKKLLERRMPIGYVPGALVYHHIPPQRMTLEYLLKRMRNEGAAAMYTRYHAEGVPSRAGLLRDALSIISKRAPHMVLSGLLRGRKDRLSLDVQLHVAQKLSELAYIRRLLGDEGFRELVLRKDWLDDTKGGAA